GRVGGGAARRRGVGFIDGPGGRAGGASLRVGRVAESVAWFCRLPAVPTVPFWLPGPVTVTVLPPPPLATMGWLAWHAPAPPLPSLAQVVCMAKVPVPVDRSNEPPGVPGGIQAHLSPFSAPLASVYPPGGFWSVMVSAYSWPFTIDTPSKVPPGPPLTKFWPRDAPMSVMEGVLVNAISPTAEATGAPLRVVSPFQSCHAQNCPEGVLYPSGWVLCGDTMMYCASRLEAAVVLPKWLA